MRHLASNKMSQETIHNFGLKLMGQGASERANSFVAESAFDRSFNLDDQSQIRLGPNNNTAAAAATGGIGMKKKKPLYSHQHQPAVYQEHKVQARAAGQWLMYQPSSRWSI